MAQKQRNIAQDLFPNEYKAITQLEDVKANKKTQVPENRP